MTTTQRSKPLVLIVEDETALVELLTYNLERAGYATAVARDGEEAELMVQEAKPDLVLLDWMLPYTSGIEICRRLRRRQETRSLPIVLLTARGEESDRVRGLEVGADDYVVKPFSPRELLARIAAVLRRSQPGGQEDLLEHGDVALDLAAHRVMRGGRPIDLGPTEFRLLAFLMRHPGRVFSREQLLNAVWGHDAYIEPRTVDVHIGRLRKAVNEGDEPDVIRTVRAAGYALADAPDLLGPLGDEKIGVDAR